MSVLTTPDDIRDRLGGAIRDRDHYVFIADSQRGRMTLARFLAGAEAAFGVADDAVMFGQFTFLFASAGLSREVAVLAVHKLAVPQWAVATFLAANGPRGMAPADADLFPVTEDDPTFLAGVLESLRRGDCFPVVPGVN